MKKILAALSFIFGAVFGLLFSTKRGEEIRKEFRAKKGSEQKMEVVAEETKSLFKNFWKIVKSPLEKTWKSVEKEAGTVGTKYGKEAKKKFEVMKGKAMKEMKREMEVLKKKFKR